MGRTVPSYRLASEWEKRKWKPFRERLDKSERKILYCIPSFAILGEHKIIKHMVTVSYNQQWYVVKSIRFINITDTTRSTEKYFIQHV